jgi:nicotinate-nucleotide adenylyltransferase
MNVALFGTSADPPTPGHQAILEGLAPRFDHVAVWAADNPFKPNQTPLIHRQAMLKLMVEAVRTAYQNVALQPQLAHLRSLHSVHQAQTDFPGARLTLVVGSDLIGTLPSWYQAGELLRSVDLLVVPRPGAPLDAAHFAVVEQLGGQYSIADFEGPNVSSTDYRHYGPLSLTLPEIAAYIQEHGLYATEAS